MQQDSLVYKNPIIFKYTKYVMVCNMKIRFIKDLQIQFFI